MTTAHDRILSDLGEFVAAADCARLPESIVQKAKACLLYGLAAGVASLRAPQPAQAARAADLESTAGAESTTTVAAAGSATRFIDQRRVAFPLAAFCNAVLLHSRVQEDAHPCGHLGVVAIPAVLSCAEAFGATGDDTLAALAAAYEVALRIGRDHVADLSARGLRSTPAYGVFAAAACGARLMKLEPAACAHGLALAANAACGLREFVDAGTGEFPFHPGFAARNGLVCATLAASGVDAAPTSLTGNAGFFKAFGGGADYGRRVCTRLGEEFEFEAIVYKPYPICQFLQAVARGAIELKARANGRRPTSIAIRMRAFEADFIGIRYAGPFATFPQAFMSAPFCAAAAWVNADVTFAALHDFSNQAVLELTHKVSIIADSTRGRYAPRIEVTFDDGTLSEWEADETTAAYRLTWDAAVHMNAKLCGEARVGASHSEALVAAIAGMDKAPDVRDLIAALAACVADAQSHS